MTSEEFFLSIPGYLSGELSAAEKQAFEAELENNPQLRREFTELRFTWEQLGALESEQPSPALRARFYRKLDDVSNGRTRVSPGTFAWWKPGLSGLVRQTAVPVALFLAGLYLGRANLLPPRGSTIEVSQLEGQVQELRRTVALSLLERPSATSRLEGVSWTTRVDQLDPELLSALLNTLNHDGNTNVRLSSLEALQRFAGDPQVREALVQSIPSQDSPLVQIALIDALVHLHDHAASDELRKLSTDRNTNPDVQQRARWGLERLSLN